ncbi:hypothetical protein OB905_10520 [Halobacteria archaeon AArc-dxtr1]|nr:hypothetical protein [Halobacteria archaeon AArc-dxtr1]
MHFDQRTQQALRDVGLDTDDLRAASETVTAAVDADAAALEAFFEEHDTVYSDMEMAHSASEFPEHTVDHLDLTTHADEMRGWLRFDSWGVYVENGRILEGETDAAPQPNSETGTVRTWTDVAYVELSLGPTIHDRVRFAPDRETLQ